MPEALASTAAMRAARSTAAGFHVAVDHVHAEDERNAQPALFDGYALHFADLLHALDVEQSADFAAPDGSCDVARLGLSRGDVAGAGQVELSDLLFEGHAAQQAVDEAVHFRLVPCGRSGLCEHRARRSQSGEGGEDSFHIFFAVVKPFDTGSE